MKNTLETRFWAKVDRRGEDECWPWTGMRHQRGRGISGGYGILIQGTRHIRAHRFSWEIHQGPIPAEAWILHTCDNPPCVNPRHLYIGDHKTNMADRDHRGRTRYGEGHPRAKLTADQIRKIRELVGTGISQNEIGRQFGLGSGHTCQIIRRKVWRSVV